jgi:hypothetical protein
MPASSNRRFRGPLALALLGLLVAAAPAGAEPPEPVVLAPGASGIASVAGELEPLDVDVYHVDLAAGDLLFVALFDGPLLDSRIAVLRDGTVLAEDDDGGPGFGSRLALSVAEAGTHEIRVTGFRDANLDGSHAEGPAPYQLVVAVAHPPLATEAEPNDAVGSEDALPSGGGVVRGRLDALDVDRFALDVASGQTLTASLFQLDSASGAPLPDGGAFDDTRLGVFAPGAGPSDPPQAENDDGGPGFLSNTAHPVGASGGGRWTLAVTGFRDTDPGYQGSHPEGPFDYVLVAAPLAGAAARCEVVAPSDRIDVADIGAIFDARGTAASGPDDPRDADGDGQITVLDGSLCRLECTFPRCRTSAAPLGCGLLGIEPVVLLALAAGVRRARRSRNAEV